jgi:hypothetical protein
MCQGEPRKPHAGEALSSPTDQIGSDRQVQKLDLPNSVEFELFWKGCRLSSADGSAKKHFLHSPKVLFSPKNKAHQSAPTDRGLCKEVQDPRRSNFAD